MPTGRGKKCIPPNLLEKIILVTRILSNSDLESPEYALKNPAKMVELEEMVKKALQLIMNVDGKLKHMRT